MEGSAALVESLRIRADAAGPCRHASPTAKLAAGQEPPADRGLYASTNSWPMHIACRLFPCLLLLVVTTAAGAASPSDALRADHAAWQAARAGYAERLAAGGLGDAERRDYVAFLEDLEARVASGCAAVRALGEPIPDGVDCPEGGSGPAGSGAVGSPAATRAEGRAELDAELGTSLGQFDELLLREQDRVRASRPRDASAAGERGGVAASSGRPGGAVAGTTGHQSGPASAQGASPGSGPDAGPTGDREGEATGASTGVAGQGGLGAPAGRGATMPTPTNLPDPSGDDVVARQLREAAEQERDPELRARLWDEYRRYRSGTN